MTTHPQGYKFGVKPRTTPRVTHLPLAAYRSAAAPPPPAELIWDWNSVQWGEHLNDHLGDCVVAAAANRIEAVTARDGTFVPVSDLDCLSVYEAACNYNPKDPTSDQGCDPSIVEQYLVSTGLAGHKVDAYAQVDLSDFNNLKDAVNWFGQVGLTINIPSTMAWGDVWDTPAAGWTVVAGHEISLIGYDANYYYAVTWGYVQKVTEGFLKALCTLALVGISKDMLKGDGTAFNGLNYTQLLADLDGGNGVVPVTPSFWNKILNWWSGMPAPSQIGVVVGVGFGLTLIYFLLHAINIT